MITKIYPENPNTNEIRKIGDLLRNGGDTGTTLLLDSRISNASRTFINGPAATNPIRIEFIYSE